MFVLNISRPSFNIGYVLSKSRFTRPNLRKTCYHSRPHFCLTLSLIQTLSNASAADGFLKTQWQKKKLLKTSNFSFCHNVFHCQSQVIYSIIEIFYFLTKNVQSCLLQNCRMREKVKLLETLEITHKEQFYLLPKCFQL